MRIKIAWCIYLFIFSIYGIAQPISSTVNLVEICAGEALLVNYNKGNTIFNVGNTFTAQLSDENGSFVSPINIGFVTDTGNGVINTFIPASTLAGNAYRVRIVSSNPVSVGNDNGIDIVINAKPIADFNVSNVCLGTASIFNNTTTVGNGSLNYVWNFGDGNSSNNPTPTNVYNAFGNYTVTLIATSNYGCKDTIVKNTTIFQQPQAGFLTDNVCLSDSMKFTNTTVGTSVTFQWSFGDGNFSALPNPAHLYTASGNYNVRLISTNLSGCRDTFISQVTVYPNAIAAFSGNNICLGKSISFDNLSSISSGTLNYVWNFGDGSNSNSSEPTKTYTVAGNYIVTLVANSNNGCSDTLSQSFTVFPQPLAQFNAANVCNGDTVMFNNTSTSVINTYNWNFGDGNFSNLQNAKHLYATSGSYNVTLIVSNSNCADTATNSISIFAKPVSSFSTANTCLGNSTNFTNQSSIANGIMSYQWLFGDGNNSINASPSYTYQDTGIYTVILIATSNNNCIDSSFIPIEIFEQPIANFNAADVCLGNSILFQNTSSGNNNNYQWSFGDNTNDTAANPIKNYTQANTYVVSLKVMNTTGCFDSLAKNITIFPAPNAAFNTSNVCLGSPSVFTNQSQINNAALNFEWHFGNGDVSNDINPNYVYDSIGIYAATLVAKSNNGCTDTAQQQLVIYPFPEVSFSANTACFGKEVAFVNTTDIAFGTINYEWQLGDGIIDTASNPLHIYNSLGVFNVMLKATSDQGCVSDTQVYVTVHPSPNANFTSADVCENDSVRFINLSVISAGNLQYQWQWNNNIFALNTEPAFVFQDTFGTLPITLIANSDNNCFDTLTKNIFINPLPDVSFEANNTCLNETLMLNNTTTISTGNVLSHFWSLGDGSVLQEISPTKQYNQAGTYDLSLRSISDKGCSAMKEQTIIVYPNADATIRPLGNIAFCDGEQLTLSAGTLIDSFQWSTSDTTQTTIVRTAGNYTVTVTTANGCTATDDIDVIVYALPIANAGNDTTISKGFDANLKGNGGVQYAWQPTETLNDANIQNPIASPLESITYTLTVTDSNNCKNTDEVVVTVLEDYNLIVTNVITPNNDGANDQFEIINIETYPQAELLIFDRWGTELEKMKPYNNDWKGTYKGKELPDGTYYYVIRFEGNDKLYKGSVSVLR